MLSALHFNLTLSSVLVDSISVAVSRRVLSHVVTQLKTLPGQMSLELCIPLLNTLRPRMISFEEQVILKVNVSMRISCLVISLIHGLTIKRCCILTGVIQMTELHQHVASLYEGQAEYCQAAIQLASVPLENSQRNYSKEFKLQVRIMSTSLLPSDIVYRVESHLGPVMSV